MPKKNMTPEERAAWGAKMRAARKVASERKLVDKPEQTEVKYDMGKGEDLSQTVKDLQAQVQELLSRQAPKQATQPGFTQSGSLVGSFEKYITDPLYYPDPRDALADEPRLRQYWIKKTDWTEGTPANFELKWTISTTQYETVDNRRVKEPRFTIELVRILKFQDLTEKQQADLMNQTRKNYEPEDDTQKRFVITRGIFHEDPEAAIDIATRNGLAVDTANERQFLNQMRYLRLRDWLLEAFYPPKSDPVDNKLDTVIGNKLVEVYTVSNVVGEATPKIPFGELNHKL